MADEGSDSPQESKGKKRRLHGACDACRKRKSDSAVRPGNMCSNCDLHNIQCTHDVPRPPKKKEAQEAYIHHLEVRVSKVERILQTLYPDRSIEALLSLSRSEITELTPSTTKASSSFPELKYPTPQLSSTLVANKPLSDPMKQEPEIDPVEEKQDLSHVELVEHMNKLLIEDKRFFGQSSTYMFAQHAMQAKMDASGTYTEFPFNSKMLRRPLYWGMRPWEISHAKSEENAFVYPEPDLLDSLVTLYFEKSNIIMPILHRPTFLRSLNSGLHLRDYAFGMTVLLVCANGSRFTSDSRVVLDEDISDLSSGWKYFIQVPVFRTGLLLRSTLYDLQCYALSIVYLLGTSTAHVAWPLIGLGMRFAQEKGIHRRKGQKRTAEDESAKLAFWCLICIDRWMSAFLGRPCAMQDEEFDLEYPVECDEEYWETPDPEKAFQQPPGMPSKMSYFIWMIKVAEMLGFAHKTLYATRKSKILIGLNGNEWESRVVSELDSSMNKWKDNLPHFLRWDPDNPDDTFFCQSVALYTSFYHLQIQVHRPFLMKRSALSHTSLAMCICAARSTAHVLEVALSRGAALFASSHICGFVAALVLLLTQWAHQQSDSTFDSTNTMQLVRKLFLSLKEGERRWQMAGRFVDLMQTLDCLSDPSTSRLKRHREESTIEPRIQSQDHHGALWEQPSFAGGPLQRQIAAAKLEPPTHMQAYCGPTSNWDSITPEMGSHVHQPFLQMVTQINHSHPIGQNTDSSSFLTRTSFQTSSLPQHTDPPYLPYSQQAHISVEDPSAMGLDVSDDIFAMWENAPISFSSYDWDIFLTDAMQDQSGP